MKPRPDSSTNRRRKQRKQGDISPRFFAPKTPFLGIIIGPTGIGIFGIFVKKTSKFLMFNRLFIFKCLNYERGTSNKLLLFIHFHGLIWQHWRNYCSKHFINFYKKKKKLRKYRFQAMNGPKMCSGGKQYFHCDVLSSLKFNSLWKNENKISFSLKHRESFIF